MAYAQGSVVLAPDPYKQGSRPLLVASNDIRPYYGQDYTLAVITTTEFDEAVRLDAPDVTEGGLNTYPSFVKPWSLHELEHDDIHTRVAQVSAAAIEQVADGITRFHEPGH